MGNEPVAPISSNNVRSLSVLTLNSPAVEAIRMLTGRPGLPSSSGLRIVHGDTAGGIELFITPQPDVGDQIREIDGVRVFLHENVAAMLSDRSLGAEISEDDVVFRIQ
jgi:iron-sulfur cluster assembly protein